MVALPFILDAVPLLVGVLPLLITRVRRWAVWLAVAWSLPALVIGMPSLIQSLSAMGVSPVEGLYQALAALLTRWPLLGRAYMTVPVTVGVACGLSAVICYVVALRVVRPLRWPRMVALGVLVLLAVGVPSVPVVYQEPLIARFVKEAAAAAAAHPDRAAAQWEYAYQLYGTDRYAEALKFAERAQELDRSGDWSYPHEVGLILLALRRPSEALAPLERAYLLQRAEKPPPNTLAERLRRSGLSEAEVARVAGDERFWTKMIREHEGMVARSYAAALVLNDRVTEATDIMARAVSRLPDDRSVRSWHLLLLWSQGREAEATAELPGLAQCPGTDHDRMTKWVRRYHNQADAQRELRRWAEGHAR